MGRYVLHYARSFLGFLARFILKTTLFVSVALLIGVSAAFIVALANYRSYASELVPPNELALNNPSMGAKILDRNGTLLYEYVDDKQGIRLPISLRDVNPAFLAATIATEDANFFSNPGVNPRGLARAAWENFNPLADSGELLQGTGGSSITQQLVKNVYIPEDQRHERSIDRKMREIVYSLELTKRYDKAQILEWYVNQISYGGIYTGVEAASQGYFGKPARDLTLAEAALLAGIPQSPASLRPGGKPGSGARTAEPGARPHGQAPTDPDRRGHLLRAHRRGDRRCPHHAGRDPLAPVPDRGAALRPHLRRASAGEDLRQGCHAARRPGGHDDARLEPPVPG